MGVRNALQLFKAAEDLSLSDPSLRRTNGGRQGVNTWVQSGDALQHIAWSDLFATIPQGWATRAEALRVPAVTKARALLFSLIAPRPLVALNAAGPLPPAQQPTWLYRTDGLISPQVRTQLMLDDLIFHEATLLAVRRGAPADGGFGPILDAVHVPRDRWEVDPDDGTILIDDEPSPDGSVLWIPGPWAGLLREAGDVIRGSRDMTRAWINRARTPVPTILLKETEANGLTDAEVETTIERVASARRSSDGTVMWIPYGVEATIQAASDDAQLFENGRNALRLDVANFLNIPAALLDGSPNTASLTYQTREGQRNDLLDYSLSYWTLPIEAALSMDNVVPRGTRVRFDFTDLNATTNAPTGAATED